MDSPGVAPTTDFALIESQKENIRPLATGRSAATLSTVFKEPSAADKLLQQGHEQHRKAIQEADRRDAADEDMPDGLSDVLDVYNQYILFTVQHHPSSDAHLLPLLETTTRRFINDARYTHDIRYLKLWIMYARQIDRREEIWAFLESRDIGTRHSLFYEEWATTLEGMGRRKKADEIYRLGIARKASPLDRLKNRHKQFLERIMAPPSGVIPDDDPASAPARTPSRSVLGQVRTAPSSSVSGATQLAPSLRSTSVNNGRKMEIFADEEGKADDTPASEWPEFGSRDERKKENTVEAGPWKGETLPQSAVRGRVAPRTPKVEVFQDGEEGVAPVQTNFEVFSRHKQPPTEAELLKSDPLRHYDTTNLSTDIPSLPAPPSARKPPKPLKSNSSASASTKPSSNINAVRHVMQPWTCPTDGPLIKLANGTKERRMFNWELVYKDGEEWSFEEIRAKQRGLYGKEWRREVQEWERQWHKPGSSTPPKPKPLEQCKPPSPTVNTKLAEAEVMRMFDQTIHGGKIGDSDSESDSEDDDEEDDDPIQVAPTPLPARTGSIQMLAPTPGGFVPPTPTPNAASRLFSNNENTKPVVFSDENAVPPSATKKKFNIFSDDPENNPTKTPLGAAPPSATQSRAFGIFSDENQTPAKPISLSTQETPGQRQPLGQSSIFGTPAPVVPGRGALLSRVTEVIEEDAEEDAAAAEEQASRQKEIVEPRVEQQEAQDDVREITQDVEHVTLNDVQEEDELEDAAPRGMRRFNINLMTPITERTCEYTTFTQGTTAGKESFAREEEEEEEEKEEVKEEPPISTTSLEDDTTDAGLASGDVDSGFQLPDGFTIHRAEDRLDVHTMVLIDDEGKNEPTGTMTINQDKSVYHTAPAGSLSLSDLPNPCDPISEQTISALLSAIDPPLSSLPGLIDNRTITSNKLDSLEKHTRSKMRRASTSSRTSTSAAGDDTCLLELAGKPYEVRDKLGEGGFGVVFLGIDVDVRRAQDEADSDDEDEEPVDRSLVALKVERPGAMWEAAVLDRIHRRVNANLRASIILPRNLYLFKDESFLILDYCSQGTLLDVVNKSTAIFGGTGQGVDELLAMFFTIELLKLLEGLHSAQFIHGDLKIDNCLVRISDLPNSQWSASYSRTGSNGWSAQGLRLIDFGRAIDLSLFPAGEQQMFKVSHKVDERDCTEMRRGEAWNFQTDYFGLASVAYCLLFGKYMKTEIVDGKVKIDQPLKRYWQTPLWTVFFETLLNPDDQLPITNRLGEIRSDFEGWLEENSQKGGKSLKSLLRKIELAATTSRKL
ncbi:checkpoint serine/threonine-protein kinase [Cryptococcus neoformans Ze90-1]|nr:checkpoint serine/threonine-protein kinase [Cryptococcus neoformans var. grubii Ze90-1]